MLLWGRGTAITSLAHVFVDVQGQGNESTFMKFTNGGWLPAPGMSANYATEIDDIRFDQESGTMTVYASTRTISDRADTLNAPLITVTFQAEAEGVIRTKITHLAGRRPREPHFELNSEPTSGDFYVAQDGSYAALVSGSLEVRVACSGPWRVEYREGERLLTKSDFRSVGAVTSRDGGEWIHEQLSLEPAESVYGLGERFGPFVKNGQAIDIWNEDGGTRSEQAYKSVPFYVSSRGYGVFVDNPAKVSFEVASTVNTRAQFSVSGQTLEYIVLAGPTMKDVLRRYTLLTGRAPQVPDWSYGLWLSTSFTTDYDERTVMSFVDGMIERGLPLSVFHFDCFWMREYQWVDFTWDERMFPDPEGMLARLKAKGLRICVWINPYIGQRSRLFNEAMERGYLVRTTSGDVWQWDMWQAGMGLVDFTNPAAAEWYADKLRVLLDQGVDCFKTDFGERIPFDDIQWYDGSDNERMHNFYSLLYNQTVFDLLKEVKGEQQAIVFARSATVGGQQYPVHWGGDNQSDFASMAETLRGGLSLGLSGFGYWSHDIGGFEGDPNPEVFKRWVPFGLLSSHSRFHGSSSYRVPWAFGEEAVDVTRKFAALKMRLMPYLAEVSRAVTDCGTPMMRPMVLEFPEDRSTHSVDTQYMLGDALCVSPVFSEDGRAQTYLPEGAWRHLLTGARVDGSRWIEAQYGFDSLGLFLRPGTVIALGSGEDVPEYEWARDVTLLVGEISNGDRVKVHVPGGTGVPADFTVAREGNQISAHTANAPGGWTLRVLGQEDTVEASGPGVVTLEIAAK